MGHVIYDLYSSGLKFEVAQLGKKLILLIFVDTFFFQRS